MSQIIEHWLPWQGDAYDSQTWKTSWTNHNLDYLRRSMQHDRRSIRRRLTIAVIGAGGKMGMRVSNNLARSRAHRALQRSPGRPGQERGGRPRP